MDYKIVFSDIDGTLLNKDRELSPATIDAVKSLSNKIPFILISARMPAAMRHLQEELEIGHLPIIAYNGGLIIVDGKTTLSTEIPLEVVEELSRMNEFKCHLSLYHRDEWYVPQSDKWALREINNTKVIPVVRSNDQVIKKWDREEKGAHKIMAMGEIEQIDTIRDYLEEKYPGQLHLYRSKDTYLEIAPSSISKFTAIEMLLKEHFHLSPKEAVAIGDNYNDIEMLRKVGYGVAVGNARQEAMDAANIVCGKSIEDGVAKLLVKIFK
ncbi:HAD family hydrolase [Antarcticibacterium flavum]|uniref:HAD family hydrolase n=1 Tax=Antarcticibacterium flavum TaxID=2058175 RepID=A0A5B7X6G6_9FLAO|nr:MULTISPECIES: HAD family hydrolase [Antarcticibacterium]MCM4159752.1 Cof-type HAD-IIB family hydrolase [Antarcticibacterium sp. W02-3]QCY70685.1 HAD family hydrolase [Antarcticibacterium flavum]